MSVTMQDIANRAGVSRPVVSAVLGGRSTCRVSEEKRRQILSLVEELHFQRNRQASCLRQGRKAEAGVFLPDWNSVLILKLIRGLNESAQTWGIPLHFYFGMQMSSYEHFIHAMAKSRHSAILSYVPFYSEKTTPELSAQLQQYIEDGGRVITLNTRHWEIPRCCSVGMDERHGGVLAAQYLRKSGSASYAAVGFDDCVNPERLAGFAEELGEHPDWISLCPNHPKEEHLDASLTALMEKSPGPVGIFSMNESLLGHIFHFMESRWKMGEDYHLIGYDGGDLRLDCHLRAGIVQPFEELGRQAVNLLEDLFEGRQVTAALLKPALIGESDR